MNRSRTKLRDRKPRRDVNSVVLIVCEGEKTEKNYLSQLKDFLKISNVRIEIISSKKSAPFHVAKTAIAKKKNNIYDLVYCVFDRDVLGDEKYVQITTDVQKTNGVESIVSNPCFEYWLLLHFEYTNGSFGTNGNPCDELISKRLKKHLKNYAKDYNFQSIFNKLDKAINNAQAIYKQAELESFCCSYTEVFKLVNKLLELKQNMIL